MRSTTFFLAICAVLVICAAGQKLPPTPYTPVKTRAVGLWECRMQGESEDSLPVAFAVATVQQDVHAFFEISTVDRVAQKLSVGSYIRVKDPDNGQPVRFFLGEPNCVVPNPGKSHRVVCTMFPHFPVEFSKVDGLVLAMKFDNNVLEYAPCKKSKRQI